MKQPTALVILDGFGYRADTQYNAIAQAHTPTLDYVMAHYPHTLLQASGRAVGLLDDVQGNSEVGHITIGAGRIINQPITILQELIETHELEKLPAIKQNFEKLASDEGTLHIMGLASDAGIHAHIDHMIGFITVAHQYKIKHVKLHCFLDGRDTPPQSAREYLTQIDQVCHKYPNTSIASICGRFYAMDRNKEWTRTQQAYDMLTVQESPKFATWQTALDYYYQQNITDEFVPPTQLTNNATVQAGDGIVFTNTRPDRALQLTQAFVDPNFDHFTRTKISLSFFITPTHYNKSLATIIFIKKKPVHNTLMEVLCKNNFSTFTIAETEKYAHVTYFLNNGRESTFPRETRVLVPSISAMSYKDTPEMRAQEITDQVLKSLETAPADFYVINYANPDMVGHSGDPVATIKAIEFLDKQINFLYKKIVEELNGTLYITSDHGKAELMYNEKLQQPYTAHTTNPVPFVMVSQAKKDSHEPLPLKELKDIAPFILKNLGASVPAEMKNS